MPFSFESIYRFGRKHARGMIALFFLLILALGFATTASYGHAWDDGGEMNILRMALKEYACILPFESDFQQTLLAMDLPRISESIERDHGICVYYPLFWAVGNPGLSQSTLLLIWRCYTWTVFTAGLVSLYACARHMGFSRPMCCLGVLMMLLSPRFFAEGHYNNKDIPLMALTLMLLWQTARMMERPSPGATVGFSLAAGFCAGTRVIGVALCGLCGGMIVLHLWRSHRLNRQAIAIGCLTVVLSVLVYAVLTPSFLADPLDFIQYTVQNAVGFSRWSGSVLLWGKVYSSVYTKPPRSYLPTLIAVTTPLWALALLMAGCVRMIRRACRQRLQMLCPSSSALLSTTALCWMLPLLGGVAVRMMAYNGWRHAYFVYGPMVLCMLVGLSGLHKLLARKKLSHRLGACVLAVCMACSALGIAVNHPYQYGYYNALVPRENRARLFEMDYWNLSCLDAIRQLLASQEGPIHIAASDKCTQSGLEMAACYISDERFRVITESGEADAPNYIIANLSYAAMEDFEPGENLTPVVTISSYGCPVTIIYRVSESDEKSLQAKHSVL